MLYTVFESEPQAIITYTCSTEDRQGEARSFAFRRWYNKYGNGFVKIDYMNSQIHEYSAAIYKSDHPKKLAIEKLFNATFRRK